MKEIDEHILLGYIDGTLPVDEVAGVEEWLAASPENGKRLEQVYFMSEMMARLRVMRAADTEGALNQFKLKVRQKTHKQNRKLALRHVLGVMQRVAVVLFIPLFLMSAYLFIQRDQRDVRMLAIRTNPGVVSSFSLPDGSMVWLNSDSELRYPSEFDGDIRSVELTGQGFFEVTKNPRKPFIVKAGKDYSVEVLGTSFNISAYKDEELIETTLVEGSVKLAVATPDGKRVTRMLRPNEKAEFHKTGGGLNVFEVNTESDTAWKQGEIIFRNHPMGQVLKTLSRHYQVEFDVKDQEILSSIITARFKDEQLPQVLEYLRLASDIRYTIHKPVIKDGGMGTSVVEISK